MTTNSDREQAPKQRFEEALEQIINSNDPKFEAKTQLMLMKLQRRCQVMRTASQHIHCKPEFYEECCVKVEEIERALMELFVGKKMKNSKAKWWSRWLKKKPQMAPDNYVVMAKQFSQ